MNRRINRSLLIFACLSFHFVDAQQETQYSNFMVNPYLYNPAIAGAKNHIDIKAGYRKQWTGVEGAPQSMYLSGHAPLGAEKLRHARGDRKGTRHSVGGAVINDRAGALFHTALYGSYAYTLTLAKGKYFGYRNKKQGVELSFGANAGTKRFGVDAAGARPLNTEDAVYQNLASRAVWLPDASLGGWLHFGDFTYVGLSLQQIFGNRLKITEASSLSRHLNAVAGIDLPVAKKINLLPSLLVRKSAGAPLSYDANLRIDYNDQFFGGFSYRKQDAVSFMLGMVLENKYEIYYSYDHLVSGLREFSTAGGHEIVLGFRLERRVLVRSSL